METSPAITFESAEDAADLLAAYDPVANTWAFPQEGDFWEAVRIAHAQGLRGAGQRIAIIDTACDLRLPLLARSTGGRAAMPSEDAPSPHGTVVALLVATVAPDASLDIYEITRDGAPDIQRIVDALEQVGRSDADLVCLSFGMQQEHNFDAWSAWFEENSQRAGGLLQALAAPGGWPKAEISPCRAEICICKTVDGLRGAGKRVLAAVGNTEGRAFCPATAAGAISVGFQRDRRERVGGQEVAWSADPDYAQSALTGFTLMQPDGVLGSSFATPLFVGALALGVEAKDMQGLTASSEIGALADRFHAAWSTRADPARDVEEEKRLAYMYRTAIATHPHYPSLAPTAAFGSALFSVSFFINAGLFFMCIGELGLAHALLSWTRRVVPGNCHAAANLGKTLYLMAVRSPHGDAHGDAMALAREASAQYADALRLRPDFEPYVREKARIDHHIQTLAAPASQAQPLKAWPPAPPADPQ